MKYFKYLLVFFSFTVFNNVFAASTGEIENNCMGSDWQNICNYTSEELTQCPNPNFAVKMNTATKKLHFYEKGTPNSLTNPKNIEYLNGNSYLWKNYRGYMNSHLSKCQTTPDPYKVALAECQNITPNCARANFISTQCGGESGAYLTHGPTAIGSDLKLKLPGTPLKTWNISYSDIGVNGCNDPSAPTKENAVKACKNYNPSCSHAGGPLRLQCGNSGFIIERMPKFQGSKEQLFLYHSNGMRITNSWEISADEVEGVNSCSVGNLTDAVKACSTTLNKQNACLPGGEHYRTNTRINCGHTTTGNYQISLDSLGNAYLRGVGDKLLEEQKISLNNSLYSSLNVPSCEKPQPTTGNILDAVAACTGKVTTNDCGMHFTNRVCSGDSNNGYLISSVANAMGGADIKIKGVGNKQLTEFIANPNGFDAYNIGLPNCSINAAVEPTRDDAIKACSGTELSCGANSTQCSSSDFRIYRDNINDNTLRVVYEVDSSHINYAFNNKTWDLAHTELNMSKCIAPPTTDEHYNNAKQACAGASVACSLTQQHTTSCNDTYSVVRSPFTVFNKYGGDKFAFHWKDEKDNDVFVDVTEGDFTPSNTNACHSTIKQVCSGANAIKSCSTESSQASCGYSYTVNRNAYNPTGSGSGGEIFITRDNDSEFKLEMSASEAKADACYSNDNHRQNAINKCSGLNLACGSSDVNQSCGSENGFDYRIARTGFDKFLNTGGEITLSAVDSNNTTVWSGAVGATTVNAASCSGYSSADLYNLAKNMCAGKSTSCALNSSSATMCGSIEGASISVQRSAFAVAEDKFKFNITYQGQTLLSADTGNDYTDANPNACVGVIKQTCIANAINVNSCSSSKTVDSCGYHGYVLERSAYNPIGDGSGGELTITKNNEHFLDVSAQEMGVDECKSNNYYLSNQTCSDNVNNYCQEIGYSNRSCGNNYYLSRTNYDMDENTGGDLTIKLPNNQVLNIDKSVVGAKECISSARHRSNAVNLCSNISHRLNKSSCSMFGISQLYCGQTDGFIYKANRSPYNKTTDVGGQISLHSLYINTHIWNEDINSDEIGAYMCKQETPPVEENKNSIGVDAGSTPNVLDSAF